MKYLALLTPTSTAKREDFGPLMIAEEKIVWAAYCAGRLREFYIQPNPTVVSLIFEAPDRAAVDADLDLLPMMKAGLLDRRVVEMGPWQPLEALFDKRLMDAP